MDVDWSGAFAPSTPVLEIVVRGSVTYLVPFALLRAVLKRESAGLGMADLLVVVLISDAAQNAMSDAYRSITDGVILVAVLIGWAFVLDRLASRVPAVARITDPPPLPLVRDGRMLRRNMRRMLITEGGR